MPAARAGRCVAMAMLLKRSFSLSGHRTSVALEKEFWLALERMAANQGIVLSSLVASIDAAREANDPLASRLRVAALLGTPVNS